MAYDPSLKMAVACGNYYDLVVANLATNYYSRLVGVADGALAKQVVASGRRTDLRERRAGADERHPAKADLLQMFTGGTQTVYTFSDATEIGGCVPGHRSGSLRNASPAVV